MRRQWLVTLIVVGLMLSGCIGPEFQDLDEDGIEDSEDLDMDGDGWDNLVEIDCNSDPNNFDKVISRFGVMFFENPEEAFQNIYLSMKSGGKITFVCWSSFFKNEFF